MDGKTKKGLFSGLFRRKPSDKQEGPVTPGTGVPEPSISGTEGPKERVEIELDFSPDDRPLDVGPRDPLAPRMDSGPAIGQRKPEEESEVELDFSEDDEPLDEDHVKPSSIGPIPATVLLDQVELDRMLNARPRGVEREIQLDSSGEEDDLIAETEEPATPAAPRTGGAMGEDAGDGDVSDSVKLVLSDLEKDILMPSEHPEESTLSELTLDQEMDLHPVSYAQSGEDDLELDMDALDEAMQPPPSLEDDISLEEEPDPGTVIEDVLEDEAELDMEDLEISPEPDEAGGEEEFPSLTDAAELESAMAPPLYVEDEAPPEEEPGLEDAFEDEPDLDMGDLEDAMADDESFLPGEARLDPETEPSEDDYQLEMEDMHAAVTPMEPLPDAEPPTETLSLPSEPDIEPAEPSVSRDMTAAAYADLEATLLQEPETPDGWSADVREHHLDEAQPSPGPVPSGTVDEDRLEPSMSAFEAEVEPVPDGVVETAAVPDVQARADIPMDKSEEPGPVSLEAAEGTDVGPPAPETPEEYVPVPMEGSTAGQPEAGLVPGVAAVGLASVAIGAAHALGLVQQPQVPEEPPRSALPSPHDTPAASSAPDAPETALQTEVPTARKTAKEVEKTRVEEQRDTLGLAPYADALARYVKLCDTPTNMVVHGAAGSGKTFLLELMRRHLEGSGVTCISFDPLNYQEFTYSGQIGFVFLRFFLEAVEDRLQHDPDEIIKQKIDRSLALMKTTASAQRRVALARAARNDSESGHESPFSGTIVDSIDELRINVSDIIDAFLGDDPKKRLVVFADNLDQADADFAFDLLRCIRVFVGVPRCVFVLVCDPAALEQRAEKEIGPGARENAGRVFLERAVPFSFNTASVAYDTSRFTADLWVRYGLSDTEPTEEDAEDLVNLIRYSIGPGPAGIRRIVGRTAVAEMLPDSRAPLPSDGIADPAEAIRRRKILFGVACLDAGYGRVFEVLVNGLGDPRSLPDFVDSLFLNEERIEMLDKKLDLFRGPDKGRTVKRFTRFIHTFRSLLLLDEDAGVQRKEIDLLAGAIRLLSFAGAGQPKFADEEPRKQALMYFVGKVKEKIAGLEQAPTGSSRVFQGDARKPWLGFWYTGDKRKDAWGADRLHYFLKFDLTNFNVASLGLAYSIEGLRRKGISDERIEALERLDFWAEKGYQFRRPGKDRVEATRNLIDVSCDSLGAVKDRQMDKVAQEFMDLIEAAHGLFDSEPTEEKPKPKPAKSVPAIRFQCPKCKKMQLSEVARPGDGTIQYQCKACGQKARKKI
ncbi:MAG: P-loop NTPase fold protein [Pseudomonadota bacterium]